MSNDNESKSALQIWIDALRSGNYEQGQERLVDVYFLDEESALTTCCCLGVACDLFDKEWLVGMAAIGYTSTTLVSERVASLLKNDGVVLHDFTSDTPPDCVSETLADANDQGFTFAQIADALENDPTQEGLSNWFGAHVPGRD